MSDVLRVERREHTEVWTLNRPEALNAFNTALLEALQSELDRADADRDLRCIVFQGSGDRAFSAGADLKERKTMPPELVPRFVDLIGRTFDRVARCPVPSIAAVDGFAFGGGMELALACDLRVVGGKAKMGLTETRLAIVPGAGGTQRLPRLVGAGRAKGLILTGRRIGAEEALRLGVAEFDGRETGALETALEVAHQISTAGPLAVRAAKAAIDGGFDLPMDQALVHERACYDRTLDSTDRLEALAAFAEKRPPRFTGN